MRADETIPRDFGMTITASAIVLILPWTRFEEQMMATTAQIATDIVYRDEEMVRLLDQLNDRWWRPASAGLDADLHFGLDYV